MKSVLVACMAVVLTTSFAHAKDAGKDGMMMDSKMAKTPYIINCAMKSNLSNGNYEITIDFRVQDKQASMTGFSIEDDVDGNGNVSPMQLQSMSQCLLPLITNQRMMTMEN